MQQPLPVPHERRPAAIGQPFPMLRSKTAWPSPEPRWLRRRYTTTLPKKSSPELLL
ncbi:hypothetical protein H4S00_006370, partial [Coemansia sp. D1744]